MFLLKILLSKRMLQFSQSITSQLKFSQRYAQPKEYIYDDNYKEMQHLSSDKVLHVHINVIECDLCVFRSLSAVIS